MLVRLLRTAPGLITAICLLGGFALLMTGRDPLRIAGAVLMFFALLVPFLQLPTTRNSTPDLPAQTPRRPSGQQPETPEPVGRQRP